MHMLILDLTYIFKPFKRIEIRSYPPTKNVGKKLSSKAWPKVEQVWNETWILVLIIVLKYEKNLYVPKKQLPKPLLAKASTTSTTDKDVYQKHLMMSFVVDVSCLQPMSSNM